MLPAAPVIGKVTPILIVSPLSIPSKKKRDPKPMAITIIPIIPRIDFFFSNPNTRFIQQIILKDNLKILSFGTSKLSVEII
jgi:hypothetical protein